MTTIAKNLTYEVADIEAGQAAATAAGMTLSAYASRALRRAALADNMRRAAAFDLTADDKADMDALRTYSTARLADLAATGNYA